MTVLEARAEVRRRLAAWLETTGCEPLFDDTMPHEVAMEWHDELLRVATRIRAQRKLRNPPSAEKLKS